MFPIYGERYQTGNQYLCRVIKTKKNMEVSHFRNYAVCGKCGRYFLKLIRARPQEEDFGNNTYSSRICNVYENYIPHLPHLPHLC